MKKIITNRRLVDQDQPDCYCTPEWATFALIKSEEIHGKILEPCCGPGKMSEVLKLTGNKVISKDLYDYNYGKSGYNFLQEKKRYTNIITNPPYNIATDIVEHALDLYEDKCAFLLRLAFLEGQSRFKSLYSKNPPNRIWIFSERITFYPLGAKVKGSGTQSYMWIVWDKTAKNKRPQVHWIKPGYKKAWEKYKENSGE